MNDLSFTILSESPDDAEAIERLNARTFGPGRFAKSAYRLREEVGHIPELSFTARVGTLMVGSVRLSPVLIGETKALLLGPLTIEPPFRGRGIGRQLIARALEEKVWPLIASGRIAPVIEGRFPLTRAADAHRLMETSAHIGKIVLVV